MAEHLQDQILDALRSTLLKAQTLAGERVRIEGVDLIPAAKAPALEIEVGEEAVNLIGNGVGGQRTQQRDLRLEVRAVIVANADYRRQAGELLAQVEEAIHSPHDTDLDALLPERPRLMGSRPESDGTGSQVVYVLRSIWLCRYITREGAPREKRN